MAELAAQGVVFESAYCASPLCGPSRYALLSSQLPSRTGGYDNLVIGALQVGGIGTTLLLGGFIGVTLWRERHKQKGAA